MKIAIIGSTGGIGKAIADGLTEDGHEILGFSRSNGYDITIKEQRDKIVDDSKDCDVFIVNVCPVETPHDQYHMLVALYTEHFGSDNYDRFTPVRYDDDVRLDDKLIINMSSYIIHFVEYAESRQYVEAKQRMENWSRYRRIAQVRMGWVESDRISDRVPDHIRRNALPPSEVLRPVRHIIDCWKDKAGFVYVTELG